MPLSRVNMRFGKGQTKEMETDLSKYEEGSESVIHFIRGRNPVGHGSKS